MRVGYFDCFAGASGDMILGAMIDAGLDPVSLEEELSHLKLKGWRLQVGRVNKRGLAAAKVDVMLDERPADSGFQEVSPGQPHVHPHHHHHERGHHPQPHRTLQSIVALLEESGLHPADRELAARIFRRLGEAEARAHGIGVAEVHFHEVGATDAIVDIVGACIGLRLLSIDKVFVSPIHAGSGFVRMAHGLYPVPGPATANLLEGVPVYGTAVDGELITPTGAAILTTVAAGYGPLTPMTVLRTGYGAGARDREIPNCLRLFIGEQAAAPCATDRVVVIEANVDDMNPQFYEHLFDRLLVGGALDVCAVPAVMKKGRPAQLLQVLAPEDEVQGLLAVIFRETTTIGVRTYRADRYVLQRGHVTVNTPFGPIRVKRAGDGETLCNAAPEYEDCRTAALASGAPLKVVWQAALAAAVVTEEGNRGQIKAKA